MPLLNGRLIADRRAALGLSRHELAQASGLTTGTLAHIENGGIHDNLQLDCAVKLAAALGIPIADLLQCERPSPAAIRGDVAVEALLAEQRRPIPAGDLAATLGWTLARTLVALRALDRRLSGTGQALQRLPPHRYALVPAMTAVSVSQRRDIARRQLRALNVATARVLHRIVAARVMSADRTPTPTPTADTSRNSSTSDSSTTREANSRSARSSWTTSAYGIHGCRRTPLTSDDGIR